MFLPKYTMHGFNWHDERGRDGFVFAQVLRNISMTRLPPMIPDLSKMISNDLSENITSQKLVNRPFTSKT